MGLNANQLTVLSFFIMKSKEKQEANNEIKKVLVNFTQHRDNQLSFPRWHRLCSGRGRIA
ncbi:hypothetical protein ES707_15378 [subsurface metagenome]